MKKISLLFCLIILQAGLLCGCRLPHKSSPQKPVEGENKSGLVKVQDDKKEEKKEEKEKEKEEPGKTEIVETEDTELSLLKKQNHYVCRRQKYRKYAAALHLRDLIIPMNMSQTVTRSKS